MQQEEHDSFGTWTVFVMGMVIGAFLALSIVAHFKGE